MGISEFCIRRPVFTILLMAAICVGGIIGFISLSVSALPNVDFPTISVTANLAGASPKTMASSVATPLEKQFSTISGISSMSSTNFLGVTQITLQFDLNRDIDAAALDVQTAISAVAQNLPKEMTSPPSFQKVNPADQPVFYIAISSDTLPLSQVNEYADTMIGQRLSTLSGVSQVSIFGTQKYAIRVQVDPNKLASLNFGLDDISNIITLLASNAPLGVISGSKQLYYLDVTGQPGNAEEFQKLTALWRNGSPVRIEDIAQVKDSVEDTRSKGYFNNKDGIVIAVQRQQGANTIEVVKKVRALLPGFQAQLPPSVTLQPMFDRSVSVKNTIDDVQFTLLLTISLVILVIYVFLNNIRSTLIPALAVPLSIIATYGGMYLFGFSINNISLLAITLCVGLVVDDAIVMLENIIRHMEKGTPPFQAALEGAKEVSFTIISISVSLVAVFIPVLFMGGIIGRLFREFAVTISFAILVSGVISLTLTPMLCSRIIGTNHSKNPNSMGSRFERLFLKAKSLYERSLVKVLKHQFIWMVSTIIMLIITVYLFIIAPKGFFPVEDAGFVFTQTEGAQDISFDAMLDKQKQVAEIIGKDPAVDLVFHAIGGNRGPLNTGRIFFGLKPIGKRPNIQIVMNRLKEKVTAVPGINVYMQAVQNLRVGGKLSKSMYQYTMQSSNLNNLYNVADEFKSSLSNVKGFLNVTSDLQLNSLQISLKIDQNLAALNGITYDQIRQALFTAFGSRQVGSLYTQSNTYQIIFEVLPELQTSPEDLSYIYLKSSTGKLIRLDSIAKAERTTAPLAINHQDQLPAVNISFDLAPGFALSEAITHIKSLESNMHLDKSIVTSFQGNAQVFASSAGGQGLLILLTVVVIYIILGMLYESFAHPVTILCGIPAAGFGAILILMLLGRELDVMGIIGIVLLIGIVKKNSIMMVDFAIARRNTGMSPYDAIFQACQLRFRPIMMTTMAALFGTLPIALAVGAGSELRQTLGIAVVGGLLTSQLLTLFITPVIYLYLERLQDRIKSRYKIGRGNNAANTSG